jgi:hypothetical protein
MSAVTEILDRLSGIAVLKERLAETNRNVERTLGWLLEHEKRLIKLEMAAGTAPPPRLPKPRR